MNLNLRGKNRILIYGAHLVALECYRELCAWGMGNNVVGFAISDWKDNPTSIDEKPVRLLNDCRNLSKDCLVIIAMPSKYHDEVEILARQCGFTAFERVSLESMSKFKGERLVNNDSHNLPFELKESTNDVTWLDAYADGLSGKVRCKYPTLFYLNDGEVIRKSIGLYDAYQSELEGVRDLASIPRQDSLTKTSDVGDLFRVYMIFDEKVMEFVKKRKFCQWVEPLQVGSIYALSRFGVHFDDEGKDNISSKNGLFAEMTGVHWIWKRAPESAYKGLCHYRRHFVLTREDIYALDASGVDVLLSTPRFVPGGIRRMFTEETPVKEPVLQSILAAVKTEAKDDYEGFKEYLNRSFYFPNNMVVAKCSIYDSYCEWIFPILFRAESYNKENSYGHEKDRHLAYAAELLTSYYFMKRKDSLKTVVTDYRFYG